MNQEKWVSVGSHQMYEVSNKGNVRRLWQKAKSRVLKQDTTPGGYKIVCLCKNNIKKNRRVHQLVLEAFVSKCPNGMEVMHLDNNPANNNLANLRYGTKRENQQMRKKFGTDLCGSKNPSTHLSEMDVKFIRYWHRLGHPSSKIASVFKVDRTTVWNIATGRTHGMETV